MTDGEPAWVKEEREATRRARLPIYIALGVGALLLLPIGAIPLLALGAMGYAMLRSALVHRGEGWGFGAGLGTFFLAVGVLAALAVILGFGR